MFTLKLNHHIFGGKRRSQCPKLVDVYWIIFAPFFVGRPSCDTSVHDYEFLGVKNMYHKLGSVQAGARATQRSRARACHGDQIKAADAVKTLPM